MALRLSKALGRSAESWLTMQDNYDLWHAKQTLDLANVSKLEFKYAQTLILEVKNGCSRRIYCLSSYANNSKMAVKKLC